MAALPYMQFYVADYLADTVHLTTEQHGAYMLLLMNYWQTGKPIPKKRLSRIAKVPVDRWLEIEEEISEYFQDDGECWQHLRVETDLDAVNSAPRKKQLPNGENLSGYRGYVYFVAGSRNGLVKVGYSKNPWARIVELKRDYGEDCYVAATIKTVEKSEVSVHKMLIDHHDNGEWFHDSSVINSLISAIRDKTVTTVADINSYVVATKQSRSSATPTTNTDTDTDTNTDTNTDINTDIKKRAPAKKSVFMLPDEIPPEDWRDLEDHRKAIKRPMTDRARRDMANNVIACAAHNGATVSQVIGHAIQKGWTGIGADWVIDVGKRQARQTAAKETHQERGERMAREREARINGNQTQGVISEQ